MYDFLTVKKEFLAKAQRYVYTPGFLVKPRIKDLMTRAKDFYALYDPDTGMWITNEEEAIEKIDRQVYEYVLAEVGQGMMDDKEHGPIIKRIEDTDNHLIDKWHKYVQRDLREHYEKLNQKIKFSNSEVKREDYCTYKLPYPLQPGSITYYEKLRDTLYLPEESTKWEWMTGCLIAGEQNKVQKFFVFYGEPGKGKSTAFDKITGQTVLCAPDSPYVGKWTASMLVNRDQFGTEFLSKDPIYVVDNEAQLDRVETCATLNLIVSHEAVRCNSKFSPAFTVVPSCFLVCGTNDPVQSSPKTGFARRLIDIRQTGETLPPDEYDECINQLQFERSGIAYHCLQVYKKLGKNYYNHYVAEDMFSRTDPFHNFVKDNYIELRDGTTLSNAYSLYQLYAKECNFKTVITRYRFRDNLKLYFESYGDVDDGSGKVTKNWFSGFKSEKIGIINIETKTVKAIEGEETEFTKTGWLEFNQTTSDFDDIFGDCPAQYAKEDGTPKNGWNYISTTLSEIDTKKLHYVKVPEYLIVLDFDIKDENGNKSFEKNLEAANKFPPTYAELSKSGSGIHLHYIWTGGNPDDLSRVYGSNVEVKVFSGNAALRRLLTKCNDFPIAELSSGLPMKGAKKIMVDWDGYKNEKILRSMIIKNLNKEYHQFTKPSIDYIYKLLTDAYRSGARYDVRDLEQRVFGFAMSSHNKADYCVNLVSRMRFCSKDIEESELENKNTEEYENAPIVIFDIEIFPEDENGPAFFLICWKYYGEGKPVVAMLNPKPEDVEKLFHFRLVGFNNRDYDNHMIWAAAHGYSGQELYRLSKKIIDQGMGKFPEAYNLSWADVFDFATVKQGLKKWEIQLGIHHQEAGIPWDKSVPKNRYNDIIEYCKNDVLATEAVFNHCQGDLQARMALAELSGLTINDPNRKHIIKILVGNEKTPTLVYTDLATGIQTEGR